MNGYTGHRAADAARVCVCVFLLIDGQKDNAPRSLLLIGDRCKTTSCASALAETTSGPGVRPLLAAVFCLCYCTCLHTLCLCSAHLTSRCENVDFAAYSHRHLTPSCGLDSTKDQPILDKYTNYCAGGTVLETKERNVSSCKRNKTRLGFLLFRETARTRLPRWLRFPLTL